MHWKKMTEKVQQAYVLVGNRVTVKELFNFHTCSKFIFNQYFSKGGNKFNLPAFCK
jgi:hypothetical protein